jgi:hypothetical protein
MIVPFSGSETALWFLWRGLSCVFHPACGYVSPWDLSAWGQHVDRAENGNILTKEEGDELRL